MKLKCKNLILGYIDCKYKYNRSKSNDLYNFDIRLLFIIVYEIYIYKFIFTIYKYRI